MVGAFPSPERFELIRTLGRGGNGVVYEVTDRRTGGRMALKALLHASPQAVVRFKREFRALLEFQHPSLITLHELFREGETWCFTMDLIRGTDFMTYVRGESPDSPSSESTATLRGNGVPPPYASAGAPPAKRRRDGASFDEARLRSALAQLASGLAALHEAGWVHRDVKPSNVLVQDDGRVVLVDLGLVTEACPDERATTPGGAVGTRHYMAPEQAEGRIDPASDWYSVGVMLHLAMTGHFPVAGVPSRSPAGLPDDLFSLCTDLLKFGPEERPKDADVLLRVAHAAPPSRSSGSTPARGLVGRHEELAELERAWKASRDAGPVAVHVTGAPGSGKTALIESFVRSIDRGRAVVIVGRCSEREIVPFNALDGLLDSLAARLARLPTGEVLELLPRRADLLAELSPALRGLDSFARAPADPRPPRDASELRFGALDALRELLARIAERRPLALVIDDYHARDERSSTAMRWIVAPPSAPCMLVVAAELDTSQHAVLDLGAPRTIRLGPLGRADSLSLARTLDGAIDAELAGGGGIGPYEAAGGHPRLLVDLARARAARPASGPLTIEDVLRERIASLPATERDLLAVIALDAAAPSVDELAQALGLSAALATATARKLAADKLVVESGGKLTPYHDVVRGVVVGGLGEDERRALRRRLADALVAAKCCEFGRLTTLFAEAGALFEAAEHALTAAAQAAASPDGEGVETAVRRALEFRGNDPGFAARAHECTADALRSAGRNSEAARHYESAASFSPAPLRLLSRAAEALLLNGQFDGAMAILERVLAEIGAPQPSGRAKTLASLFLRRTRLRARGLSFDERAESDVPRETLAQVDLLSALSASTSMIDPVSGANIHAAHLLAALDAGEPNRIARALAIEAGYLSSHGSAGQTRTADTLQLAEAIALRTNDEESIAWMRIARGFAAFHEGRWKEALEPLGQAEAWLVAKQNQGWALSSVTHYQLGALALLGRLSGFEGRVAELYSRARLRGNHYAQVHLHTGFLVLPVLARGRSREAREASIEALRLWGREGPDVPRFLHIYALVQCDLYEGNATTARLAAEDGWRALSSVHLLRAQLVRVTMLDLRGRAACACAAAEPAAASAMLAEARRCAAKLMAEKSRWASALAASISAVIALILRHRDAAQRFAIAEAAFADCDMALHAASARWIRGAFTGDFPTKRDADARLGSLGVADPPTFAAAMVGLPRATVPLGEGRGDAARS